MLSHNSLKTSPRFRKAFRFVTGFLAIYVIGKKSVPLPQRKKRSFLDTHDKRYFWPRNKRVQVTGAAVVRTGFQKYFP